MLRSSPQAVKESTQSYTSGQMLRTPLFWLMFIMMTAMAASGLMVISQFGAFTRDWGLADTLVFGLPALPLALSIDRITNGLTRPFFGWVSDRVGRENTMLLAFATEGVAIAIWLLTRNDATLFVLMSGVVFFGWGEIFSLFPATLTDSFGTKHATANYGFLYISFGVASVLGGPLAALLYKATGSWMPVFELVIATNFVVALLAVFALKPLRRRWASGQQAHGLCFHPRRGAGQHLTRLSLTQKTPRAGHRRGVFFAKQEMSKISIHSSIASIPSLGAWPGSSRARSAGEAGNLLMNRANAPKMQRSKNADQSMV